MLEVGLAWDEAAVRLGISAILGGAIGLEREIDRQPAGFRTHLLVALGATLFTLVGATGADGADPTRIAAGVVSGIGFIGAGAVLRERGRVHGLTTAASLWTAAAIGLAVGFGAYAAAGMFTGGALVALFAMKEVEHRFFPRLRGKPIVVVVRREVALREALDAVAGVTGAPTLLSASTQEDGGVVVRLRVPIDPTTDLVTLVEGLQNLPQLEGIEVHG